MDALAIIGHNNSLLSNSNNKPIKQFIAIEIEKKSLLKEENSSMKGTKKNTGDKKSGVMNLKNVPKDFFGRPILQHMTENIPPPENNEMDSNNSIITLTYKFHEGYSNAVRRTLYISDLI